MTTRPETSRLRGTDAAYPRGSAVTGVFGDVARTFPDKIAVVFPDFTGRRQELTYAALQQRCDAACHVLSERGVRRASKVALAGVRRPEMLVALLATLRLGAVYVPLDPTHPPERLAAICEAAAAEVLVAPGDFACELPLPRVGFDELAAASGSAGSGRFPEAASGEDAAYVMFTSGTTGLPKGVIVPHRAILRLVRGTDFTPLGPSLVTLQLAPIAFDASTFELFAPLLNGGTCVLHPEQGMPDLGLLGEVLREERVTTLWLTASLFNVIIDSSPQILGPVHELLIGGEALSARHVRKALSLLPDTRIVNGYGPTENTTFTCCYRIPDARFSDRDAIPIGSPIANTQVYVLDDAGDIVDIGEEGELVAGGDGVALGYVGGTEHDRARFVPDRFGDDPSRYLYRTGDRVRMDEGGILHFLGRADEQVKVGGHRIELGELRARLLAEPEVKDAAALVRGDIAGERRLIAYAVLEEEACVREHELRERLARFLPPPMLPAHIVFLPGLPLTPNGKLDHEALPAPSRERPDLATPYRSPKPGLEALVAELWSELLAARAIGADDEFFALGGSSLLATRFVQRFAEISGQRIPIAHMFEGTSPAQIARFCANAGKRLLPAVQSSTSTRTGAGVAVIGMAGRFPGARDTGELWALLTESREGTTFWEPAELAPQVLAGEGQNADYVAARGVINDIESFDARYFGISPREAELLDPQQRVLLELAVETLEDAGYDPERYSGTIGVWAGQRHNDYLLDHLLVDGRLVASLGRFGVILANDKDYVASRIAHRLDLRGPAISVHTACSTSLVAIHQAARAIRDGECDMALAGGAAITLPQRSGHTYDPGGMLSADGHCRPFDARATGTVFSDGAGLVLLKGLGAAMRDGDHVYGVLLGSAVNNDGAKRSSFTAPSPAGQAQVLAQALANAGVDADSIGYVEAHGTATPLGDPIEVEGLLRAYGTAEEPRCVLGSIKSNFGHLTAAAGVAGFIKAVRAVQTGIVPATLYFEEANPAIDFGGRFFVSKHSESFRTCGPRRAAVSSFGVGGTNAHVIVEEPPVVHRDPCEPSATVRLCISAGSEAALDQLQTTLAARLQDPDVSLVDAARTLWTGRRRRQVRRCIWGKDQGELLEALQGACPGRVARGIAKQQRPVAMVFPGQGNQYPGMGRGLYETEAVFREHLDRCDEVLRPLLDGESLLQLLYGADEDAATRLSQTCCTQPALFAVEYSAAKLVESYGIVPEILLGHSVGEFVAACLAGVFDFEDALTAVARRGAWMQKMPPGSMLSVRTAAAALRLPEGVDLAAINGRELTVVAGPAAEIRAFAQTLQAEGIAARELRTSHAFHSRSIEGAVAPFREDIARMRLRPPERRVISTATGRPLSAEEACDPDYWARHMRVPVLFAPAVQAAAADVDPIWVEAGPGGGAATLVRQSLDPGATTDVLSMLGKVRNPPAAEEAAWHECLARAWCVGLELAPERFLPPGPWRRVSLPPTPFDRERCWVEAPIAGARPSPAVTATPSPAAEDRVPDVTGSTPAPQDRRSQVVALVRELLEDSSGLDLGGVPESTSFLELGLDSLLLTQVATSLRRQLGVGISFRQLNEELTSLADLSDYVAPRIEDSKLPQAAADTGTAGAHTTEIRGAREMSAAPSDWAQLMQRQMELMQLQTQMLQSLAASAAVPPGAASPATGASQTAPPAKPGDGEAKRHGPQLVIQKTATQLSPTQERHLERLIVRYTERTKGSKAFTARNRPALADPRTASGFKPVLKEITYPIVVTHSKGCHLTDIDGNDYVDLVSGFGSNFFGFGADFVREAVTAQMSQGMEIGPQTALVEEVIELFRQLVPAERVAFCNTGSEAVLATLRLARTVTGRDLVVMFEGAYHGIFDEVVVRPTPRGSMPAAPGIPREAVQNILVLPWNDPSALEVIEARRDEIAAVLVEPVQSRAPAVQPREFLHAVRALTAQHDLPLIFDEIVCGFRIAPGGAQEHFGIEADLATYGKVAGGGFPIGIVAGKRRYMDALDGGQWEFGDTSTPPAGVTYFAGTFVRFPPALAAVRAVLRHLIAAGPELQQQVNARSAQWAERVNLLFEREAAPLHIETFGSVHRIAASHELALPEILHHHLRARGVHVLDARPVFLTAAHTEQDLDFVEQAFAESIADLQAGEFYPRPVRSSRADAPPTPGARLGRDENGDPAWFVEDPNHRSGFRRIAPA